MWPDPADPLRQRLTHMKGTPANKAIVIWSASAVAIFVGSLYALSYTPWFQNKLERAREQVLLQQANVQARILLQDPLIQNALHRKEAEYEQKDF